MANKEEVEEKIMALELEKIRIKSIRPAIDQIIDIGYMKMVTELDAELVKLKDEKELF